MHDRNIVQEQLEVQAVNEEEANLRVHVHTEGYRLLSVKESCEESNQSILQNLKDLMKQSCHQETGICTVSSSDILGNFS